MAKKATTIVLILVVVFLLASTVYVSIILTSDQGTTPTQSKASEIDSDLQQASDEASAPLPAELGSAPINEPGVGDTAPTSIPSEENPVPTTIAYANPTPEAGAGSSEADLVPTTALEATPAEATPTVAEKVPAEMTSTPEATITEPPDTSDLPETGLGQGTPKPSTAAANLSPTLVASSAAVVQATSMPLPSSMPVSGAMTNTIIATLIAGATIFLAFIF